MSITEVEATYSPRGNRMKQYLAALLLSQTIKYKPTRAWSHRHIIYKWECEFILK